MATLVSTAPAAFSALYSLVKAAGQNQTPQVPVFATAINQYEPNAYVVVGEIADHIFAPETIGSFSHEEHYDITGTVSVFSGSATPDDPSVVTDVLNQVYDTFNAVVMETVMSNREMPILGASPHIFLMTPRSLHYEAGPATVSGGQAGWAGVLSWAFHFDAYITPA